jgi:hypothetical protein
LHKICQHVKTRFNTLAVFAAISSVIFFFWWMWTSRWVTNVLSTCTLIWTFLTHPLFHIHQKKKVAPKFTAKIASVNKAFKQLFFYVIYLHNTSNFKIFFSRPSDQWIRSGRHI